MTARSGWGCWVHKAVLSDLSPAATFIAYNYNTPADAAASARRSASCMRWRPSAAGCTRPGTRIATANRVGAHQLYGLVRVYLCQCGRCFLGARREWHADRKVLKEFRCPHCDAMLAEALGRTAIRCGWSEPGGSLPIAR